MIQLKDNLTYLTRENQINKVLKIQRKEKAPVRILYMSEWDDTCRSLNQALASYEGGELFVVDSFNMPHSFVIFGVTSTPTLITLSADNKVTKESYTPMIYEELGL